MANDEFDQREHYEPEPGESKPGLNEHAQSRHDSPANPQIDLLQQAFHDQLIACLEECARGRRGLFANHEIAGENAWPEAARLRELAFALQAILAQASESDFAAPAPLCDQFLDLCSIHGESDPGEPRLARTFLAHIAGQDA
jgi:hypothetical protein